MASLVPALATVRPRVRGTGGDSSRLLEEIVEEYVDESSNGILWLVGKNGAGKTTALAHLAAVFENDPRYAFLDDADHLPGDAVCQDFVSQSQAVLVIAARRTSVSTGHRLLRLEPWGVDELVEYLLAAHRPQCGEVMQRLGDDARLAWVPEIARVVLDQLAADPNLQDASNALFAYLHEELPSEPQYSAACQYCLAYQRGGGEGLLSMPAMVNALSPQIRKLLRHSFIQIPLGAEQIATALTSESSPRVLEGQLPLGLVEAVGQACQSDVKVQPRLEKILLSRRDRKCHAMAASILLAADPDWRPTSKTVASDFAGAYFPRANWPEISFAKAHLELVDFSEASLAAAFFDQAIVVEAEFVQADLQGASFEKALAVGANFDRSNLRRANLSQTKLEGASLIGADLRQAELWKANLCQADLTGASLQDADLTEATLVSATLTDTDLTGCNLYRVDARRVDLRTARLERANFEKSWLTGANLEEVEWKQARLRLACLRHAHLTGSKLLCAGLARRQSV